MSDARWIEVEADCSAAVLHFTRAAALFEEGGFEDDSLAGYKARMAFMHSFFAAYTSMETMLSRILATMGEAAPVGESWHADLLTRAGRAVEGRPVILPQALMPAAQEARRFRHVTTRNYESFDYRRAGPAVDAARVLAAELHPAVTAFRQRVG